MKKETLDASLQSMVGTPVIIKHQNVTKENADKLRIGTISKAYFNEPDGWFYCEGIIWDEKAQDLIENKNWSVSCSYDFLAYNDEGGEENNIHYDKEFTNLNFTHLAIVDNPRYERANIVFNCKIDNADDQKGKWVTIKGNHIFIPDGKTLDEVIKEKGWGDKENKQSDKDRIKIADLKSRENEVLKQFYEAKEGSSEREHLQYELDALKDERFRLEDKQSDNKTNNSKEINKMLLEELKKLIFKVENNKENEMEIDEKVENEQVDKRKLIDEVAGIMKSAGCDDEVIRTAIGKMEKIGYDKSEADGKADNKKVKNETEEEKKEKVENEEDEKDKKDEVKNKCKNEDDEDKKEVKEVKEEVKEDVDNKCKNSKEDTSSFDKINEIYNSVRQLKETKTYVSRQEKLDNAVEYFK